MPVHTNALLMSTQSATLRLQQHKEDKVLFKTIQSLYLAFFLECKGGNYAIVQLVVHEVFSICNSEQVCVMVYHQHDCVFHTHNKHA